MNLAVRICLVACNSLSVGHRAKASAEHPVHLVKFSLSRMPGVALAKIRNRLAAATVARSAFAANMAETVGCCGRAFARRLVFFHVRKYRPQLTCGRIRILPNFHPKRAAVYMRRLLGQSESANTFSDIRMDAWAAGCTMRSLSVGDNGWACLYPVSGYWNGSPGSNKPHLINKPPGLLVPWATVSRKT